MDEPLRTAAVLQYTVKPGLLLSSCRSRSRSLGATPAPLKSLAAKLAASLASLLACQADGGVRWPGAMTYS